MRDLVLVIDNEAYELAGAEIVDTADEIFARADLVIKVKEPQPVECRRLREGQILFTYLHLAPEPYANALTQRVRCYRNCV